MSEDFRWNKNLTEKLIQLRHDPETAELFNTNKNHPKKLQMLWEGLLSALGLSDCRAEEVKRKYNNLLAQYRKFVIISKKSGEGAILWKYWDSFNKSFPGKVIISPDNIIEVGGHSNLNTDAGNEQETSEPSFCNQKDINHEKETKNSKKRKNLNNLRYDLYEKLLGSIQDDNEKFATKKDLKKSLKNLNNKIDKIIGYLELN